MADDRHSQVHDDFSHKLRQFFPERGTSFDLARAALHLSAVLTPGFDISKAEDEIASYIHDLRQEFSSNPTPLDKIRGLNRYFFVTKGYKREEKHDNFFLKSKSGITEGTAESLSLLSVISSKQGSTPAIAMLYQIIAEAMYLPVYGVMAPGHIYSRYDEMGATVEIDLTQAGEPHAAFKTAQFPKGTIYGRHLESYDLMGVYVLLMGRYFREKGEVQHAQACLKKAVEVNPDYPEAHFESGLFHFGRSEMQEAENSLKKAAELYDKSPETWAALGKLYSKTEKKDKAEAAYSKALEIDPDSSAVAYDLGLSKYEAADYEAAAGHFRKTIGANPDMVEAYYYLGSSFYSLKKLPDAAMAFEELLKRDPEHAKARYSLGIIYHAMAQNEKAEAAFRKVIELKPEYAPAYQSLATILRQEKKFAESTEIYEKILAMKPNSREICLNIGLNCLASGHVKEAEEFIKKELQGDHNSVKANKEMANILFDRKDYEEARKHFEKALKLEGAEADKDIVSRKKHAQCLIHTGKLAEAEKELKAIVAHDEKDAEAHAALGDLYLKAKHYEHAEKHYSDAHAAQPSDLELLYKLGEAQHYQGKDAEAAENVKKLVLIKPNHAAACGLLVEVYKKLGNHAEAEKLLQKVAGSSHDPETFFRLAEVEYEKGDMAAAEKNLRKAVELAPAHAGALAYLALVLTSGGRDAEAGEYIAKGRQADPENPKLHKAAGLIFMKKGQFDHAEAEFKNAIRGKEAGPDVLFAYAKCLTETGKFNEAVKFLEKTIELNHGGAQAWSALAVAKQRTGDEEGAEAALKKAVEISPDDPEIKQTLGMIYFEKGRFAEAEKELSAAAEKMPNEAGIHQIIGKIRAVAGKHAEAAAAYATASRIRPSDTNILHSLSQAYAKAGDQNASAEALKKITALNNNDTKAHQALYAAYVSLQKQAEADSEMKELMRLKPNDAGLHYNLGISLLEMKKTDAGLESLKKAFELDPNNPAYAFKLGELCARLVRYQEAENYFKKALDLKPAEAAYRFALGKLYQEQAKYDDAERELKKCAEESHRAECYMQLGFVYWEQSKFKEAEKHFKEAEKLNPQLHAVIEEKKNR